MSIYTVPRNLEVFVDKYKPATVGVDMERALELARTAQACITLAVADAEPFLSNLPPEAPDYHCYDDLVELIWRDFQSREGLKFDAKINPQYARGSAKYIWRQAVLHTDRELHNGIRQYPRYRALDTKIETSAFNRTVISDPAMYDFYTGIIDDTSLASGIGKRSVTYLEMLLAGTRPELMHDEWPVEVLQFMGGSHDTS